jgi:hypothetical protein
MCDKNLGRSHSWKKNVNSTQANRDDAAWSQRDWEKKKMELSPWFIVYSLMLNDPVNDINEHCGLTHAWIVTVERESIMLLTTLFRGGAWSSTKEMNTKKMFNTTNREEEKKKRNIKNWSVEFRECSVAVEIS